MNKRIQINRRIRQALLTGVLQFCVLPALAAEVYIVSPADGATVESPVPVVFGLRGMGVAPAGIVFDNTGHHHLLIDVDTLPPNDQPIPADATHLHFGKGQTETAVELKPGKHTLQLLLGDALHKPIIASQPVHITVK